MRTQFTHGARMMLVAGAVAAAAAQADAQTPLESSTEIRFQLDLHVSDQALTPLLPPGFSLNVATQGPAKDCNLRAIFVDRLTINGPDGKPVGKGSNRLVYLAAPVKDAAGATAQLVIGGLTADPDRRARALRQLPAGDHPLDEADDQRRGAAGSPRRRTGSFRPPAASTSKCTSPSSAASATAATRRKRSSTRPRIRARTRSPSRSRCSRSCATRPPTRRTR